MADWYSPARGGSRAAGEGWPQASRSGSEATRPASSRTGDDGWGPSTAVYGAGSRGARRDTSAGAPAQPRTTVHRPERRSRDEGWTPAGPASREQQRANKLMERQLREMRVGRVRERGLPWWGALLVLIVIAAIGGLIDTVGSTSAHSGFNIGIVLASIVAILIVQRSHMFPIVIAPPIVYSLAALFELYLRSSGLHDRKVVLDAAANYLVYGFPAIATATAAVLIIAGARLILRK